MNDNTQGNITPSQNNSTSANIIAINNTDLEMLQVPVLRVENILLKNKDALSDKKRWITPLSILISVIPICFASDFNNTLLPAAVWKALYIIILILSFLYSLFEGIRCFKLKKTTIESIINEIKGSKK